METAGHNAEIMENTLPYIDMTESMEAMLQKLTASNEELLLRPMHTMEQKFIT